MELVGTGRNLRDWVNEEREAGHATDPVGLARRFAGLARTLHGMHEAGILHRDLKPGNILLAGDGTWKVANFGHARVEDEVTISVPDEELGTYAYLAPEILARGRKGASERSDVFALGATLYEALTLHRAFPAATVAGTVEQILHGSPAPLRPLRPDLPRELELVVSKALEKDPGHRYPSMAAFAEDLERFVRREPVTAQPPTPLRRLHSWSRQEPWRAAALGLGMVALAASLLFWRRAEEELVRSVRLAELATTFVDLLDPEDVAHKQRRSRAEIRELVRLTQEHFGDRERAQARILGSAARALRWAEDHDEALPAAEEAWRITQLTEGADSVAALEAQLEYAWNLDQLSQHEEAREVLEDVLARLGAPPGPLRARALNRLGRCLWELDRPAEARERFLECERVLDASGEDDPALRALNALGMASVHFRDAREGDDADAGAARERAEEDFARAELGFLDVAGPFHPELVYVHIGRAQLARFFGDVESACESYRRALDLAEKVWGPEHEKTVGLRREAAGPCD